MLKTLARETSARFVRWLKSDQIETLSPPAPRREADLIPVVKTLLGELAMHQAEDTMRQREAYEMAGELMEASLMCGSGPWKGQSTFAEARAPGGLQRVTEASVELREDFFSNAQGANGLFGFEFANWDWKREINFSLLEFSRWGIQQIILISRLYYLKNPIVRRLVDVCAIYVFGRGVEVSSPDEDVNASIKRFAARNQNVLGQSALTDLERRKDYDGNLFFAFFADPKTGETSLRMIDATEIQQIVTDPEDSDTAWFFQRVWVQRSFDITTGQFKTESQEAWYPALNYEPADKPATINGKPVMWDVPVYHRKCGTVGKWIFGCPRIYPMLDWAKASRKFLEACAAVKAALAQFAMTITTKGGQQALAGIKQQLETTVGTGNSSWLDQNPTAVNGSIFGSGPGTTLSAFKSSGEGGDPEEVRRYMLMCCMVKGVPETFLADVSCYAEDTEVLTEQGFMLHQQWHPGIKVACFNPKTEKVEYHHPKELRTFDYDGEMVHFINEQTDILVTPNHRMWCAPVVQWKPKGKAQVNREWRIEEAREVQSSNRTHGWKFSTVVQEEETNLEFIDTPIGPRDPVEWARFVGYWVAEGCATQSTCKSGEFRKDGTPIMRVFRRIMLAQLPGPVLSKMRTTLDKLELRFHEVVATAGVINLVVIRKLLWEHLRAECGSGAKQKKLPRWIFSAPIAARKAMYEALMEGDGGRSGSSWCYSTASPQLADDMQLLAHSIGLAASISRVDRNYKGEPHPIWRVYIRTRATDKRIIRPKDIKSEKYKGKVYCFSLPHGIYITRRGGNLAVQGNTGNLATATSLDRPTELAFMSLQEEWREDLVIIYAAGIRNELRAPGGKLREAMNKRKVNLESFTVRESARVFDPRKGHMVYSEAAKQNESAAELMATFPSIREGDIPQLATALASAFATGTMDPKSTARKFFEYFDIEGAEDILQSMYPDATYDPDKTGEPEATPQQGGKDRPAMKEAIDRLREALDKLKGKAA